MNAIFQADDMLDPIRANEKNKTAIELLVIGAGLPRTGTASFKAAMTQLYGAKSYHMADVMMGTQADLDLWTRAMDGHVTAEEWRQFFSTRNYATGADYPFSAFWRSILEAYPNAKVVLTVRDPVTWYTSVTETIWKLNDIMENTWIMPTILRILDGRKGGGIGAFIPKIMKYKANGMDTSMAQAINGGQEASVQFFKDWEENVKRNVPADRLLVFTAKEGWEPLCKFLGLAVPEEPYPRINDTAVMKKRIKNIRRCQFFFKYVVPTAVAATAYYFQDGISRIICPALTGFKSLLS